MSPVRHVGDEGYSESVFEDELAKLLRVIDTENLREKEGNKESLEDQICNALHEAYNAEPRVIYAVGLDRPIGELSIQSVGRYNTANLDVLIDDNKTSKAKGTVKEILKDVKVKSLAYENPRKRTILNIALKWGCEWASLEFFGMQNALYAKDNPIPSEEEVLPPREE